MVIFNGFWAGFICGFFVGFVVLVFIALIQSYRQQKAKEQFGKLLNTLNKAVKEKKGEQASK